MTRQRLGRKLPGYSAKKKIWRGDAAGSGVMSGVGLTAGRLLDPGNPGAVQNDILYTDKSATEEASLEYQSP